MRPILQFFSGTLLAFLVAGGSAQDVTLRAAIQPEHVSLGEPAVFSMTVSGPTNDLPRITSPPPFDDLDVVGTRPTNSQSVTDGRTTTHALIFSWVVVAKREGVIQIPPVSVQDGQTRITSNAVTFNVMPSKLHDFQSGGVIGRSRPPSPDARGLTPQTRQIHTQHLSGNLELLICADDPAPYVGQQVNISIYLVNRMRDGNIIPVDLPLLALHGASPLNLRGTPDLDLVRDWGRRTSSIFQTFEPLTDPDYFRAVDPETGDTLLMKLLHRAAIWPADAGNLELGPIEGACYYEFNVTDARGNLRRATNRVTLSAPEVTLPVRPLPSSGTSAGTSAANVPVGRDFRIEAQLTPTSLAYDEVATLDVRVEGEVNPDWLFTPQIDGGDIFTSEPPPTPPAPTRLIEGDHINGAREFAFLIRFDRGKTGRLTTPPVTYRVFDLDREEFVTLRSDPIVVEVSPHASEPLQEITAGFVPSQQSLDHQIDRDVLLDIETTGFRGLFAPPPLATQSVAGWALILLPLFAFGAAVTLDRQRARMRGEEGISLRTRRRAARNLRRARGARDKGEAETFHAALASAVHGHLTERLGAPTAGSSWPVIDEQLADRGVEDALRRRLGNALAQSDFARFAPGVDGSEAMAQLYDETVGALRELGRQLPVRRRNGNGRGART